MQLKNCLQANKKSVYGIVMKIIYILCIITFISCASTATSAEEYYSIGMAYFEIGKYDEAGKWLEKASSVRRTMRASEYNLGRIAFETGKYSIAEKHFKRIIKDDPVNVMALKAIAYTEIKLGNLSEAESYYGRVLKLEPENTDDGYNYAMILYALNKYSDAETVLKKFSYNMPDNKNTLLLLARTKKAQNKVEAIDDYATWLAKNSDAIVRYEYAEALEADKFYARAIEELKKALAELASDTASLKKCDIHYALGRLILIADPNNDDGIASLQEAVNTGYKNTDALRLLMDDARISKSHKDSISSILAALVGSEEKQEAKPEEIKEEDSEENIEE
jgi:tetratricopeptide (TPR) repeat protein